MMWRRAWTVLLMAGLLAAPSRGRTAPPVDGAPDLGQARPGAAPGTLFGLWARNGRCGVPGQQLRITRRTVRFAGRAPIRFWYFPDLSAVHPGDGLLYMGPSGRRSLLYDPGSRVLFTDSRDVGADDPFLPCPAPGGERP